VDERQGKRGDGDIERIITLLDPVNGELIDGMGYLCSHTLLRMAFAPCLEVHHTSTDATGTRGSEYK
jgi:hypothetical protein